MSHMQKFFFECNSLSSSCKWNSRRCKPGEPGIEGSKGDKGAQGPQGAKGEMGKDGSAGIPGLLGVDGEKGNKGPQGEDGYFENLDLEQELKNLLENDKQLLEYFFDLSKDLIRGEKGDKGPKGENGCEKANRNTISKTK
uniref:Collagen IV NC1 domain-containing protein n=1 Tax=Megaselia scalaris TaxID=36166 RepID=T1GWK0_MEGSC